MRDTQRPVPVLVLLVISIAVAFFLYKDISFLEKSPFANMARVSEVKIPILMYHYVEYNQDERDYLRDQQNVPPNVFEQQIIDLKNAGYTFLTSKQIPSVLKNPGDKKYILLTFDDGFRDFYTDAYPILKKHNVPATVYLVTNFFGGQDYMTEEMIKEISQDKLIEIGSHTLNHAYLPGIDSQIAETELVQSKKVLEEKFSVKVESFAYPFGNFDETTIKLVKKAGYKTAVTVDSGNIVKPEELFKLKRLRPGHLTGNSLTNYISQ